MILSADYSEQYRTWAAEMTVPEERLVREWGHPQRGPGHDYLMELYDAAIDREDFREIFRLDIALDLFRAAEEKRVRALNLAS